MAAAAAARPFVELAETSVRSSRPQRWQLSVEWKLRFIHLYRKILREASYLPDSRARSVVRSEVVHQFQSRHLRPRSVRKARPGAYPRHVRDIRSEDEAITLHKRAVHSLRTLAAANQGALPCLRAVLGQAYGRSGAQRMAMVASYHADASPHDDAELRQLVAPDDKTGKDRRLNTKISLSPILTELVSAQFRQKGQLPNKNKIKGDRPLEVPLPVDREDRVRVGRLNKHLRKARHDTLTRLLPPLPERDWERLRDLALGIVPWQDRVLRRPRATGFSEADEVPKSLATMTQAYLRIRRPHTLSPRFMARRYKEILGLTPKLSQNPHNRKHSVAWYQPESYDAAQPHKVPSGYFHGSDAVPEWPLRAPGAVGPGLSLEGNVRL